MMPNMRTVLQGFGTPMRFRRVEKTTEDFVTKVREVDDAFFSAVIVPIPARKLVQKPEGQRSWKWWTLYSSQKLPVNSNIKGPDGLLYVVVSEADYGSFGEYELTEAVI